MHDGGVVAIPFAIRGRYIQATVTDAQRHMEFYLSVSQSIYSLHYGAKPAFLLVGLLSQWAESDQGVKYCA